MKPLRRLIKLLAACAVAAAALIQPALAADLAQDPFITDNAQRQHYEPGGKYHLFGDPRGSVSDRTGKINVIQDYTHQMGNLLIQQANINGTIGYHTRFSGHGHEEHAPFDNHAADSASKEQGNVDEGFTVYRLNWEGHEHHPADGYDGPKGGNYPKPTGARDEYTYHVNGTARSIKLNPTDTRSIRQRISDNYSNLGSNFSDRADEANRKMFEHNAKLDRWGNSMEFINGVAAGALNPFISAGEALGIGDILYGTRYAIDKAAMRNIAPLPAEGKFAAIGGLGSVAGFEKNTREAVDRWIQENPNAAETVEALVNVLPFAKVKNLTKAAKPGKAAVSGDFSKSYTCSFHGSTLVKTADGYKAIAHIQAGDRVFAKDEASGKTGYKPVTARYGNPYQETVYIEISDGIGNNQTLISNKIHPFYSQGKWIQAGRLKKGDTLLSESGAKQTVQNITFKQQPLKAYNLTVADWHTYFVKGSQAETEGVWVHNDCPYDKGNQRYKDASYHGKNDNSVKSRAPTNGQAALDNSVQVKSTSPRRVGVDKANNEIVVLDKTQTFNNGFAEYHGHVRSWQDLHTDQKNALKKAGLVNSKGKIKK
ncbi:polymorphic toxin MafB class 1 [Neisseria meningitidis]|uniref:polymorphic toxin MafB class 1 n=4 Tax=Neisseria meningitidis TaxID=487 RepID=UPI0007666EA0|nr:polymorphic toxin MafB class 1 [Neisseria meningitidis]CWO41414.1 putative adhesin MafB [Neisseria meningitidis]CWS27066.1 putative adhesin MafB [Neisseria meningitidis]